MLLLSKGADGWVNSIHSIYQYVYFKQTQEAWERFMRKEELEAVRRSLKAMSPISPMGSIGEKTKTKKGKGATPSLTRDDIERIKQSRRAEIVASDMEAPKVQPFEFFIIPNSTEAKVEPIAIGYYDPSTGEMEVATWEDVKAYLPNN